MPQVNASKKNLTSWKPGQSGNPGGLLAKLKGGQSRVIDEWGDAVKVDAIMGELYRLATGAMTTKVAANGDSFPMEDGPVRVAAAKAYLIHACPPPGQITEKDNVTEIDPNEAAAKALEALLSRPETRDMVRAKLEVIDGGKR